MVSRRTGLRARLALAAAVVVVLAVPPSLALADAVPACPDLPAAYTGTDDVVAELRAERVDARAGCLAIAGRLDRAHDDATSAAAAGHDVAERAHTDATDTKTSVDSVTPAVVPNPTPTAAASYDGPTRGQVDEGLRALHGDLWLLLGARAALIFGVP